MAGKPTPPLGRWDKNCAGAGLARFWGEAHNTVQSCVVLAREASRGLLGLQPAAEGKSTIKQLCSISEANSFTGLERFISIPQRRSNTISATSAGTVRGPNPTAEQWQQ